MVGGWTDSRQSRAHFWALLLGYHLESKVKRTGPLIFAGQVGSGFSHAELERVAALLDPLTVEESPFVDFPRQHERGHWVRPTLVAEVRFTEWTLDGLLRHPVYVRMRDDKLARQVRLPDHRPAAQAPEEAAPHSRPCATRRSRTAASATRSVCPSPSEPNLAELLATLEELERIKRRGTVVLANGSRIPVGNLDKVFWPDVGITKGELVRFYLRMAPYAQPVVADHPLVMKRFPNGVSGKSFYQHRAPDPLPAGLRVAEVREKPDRPESAVPYLVGGSLQSLMYMVQLAVISQDPWIENGGATIDHSATV